MVYKNNKYILDDGHIVKGYEAIQIYEMVKYNSCREEAAMTYKEIYGEYPKDEKLLDKITKECMSQLSYKSEDVREIYYGAVTAVAINDIRDKETSNIER